MGTYGSNTFRVTFLNKALADMFQLEVDCLEKRGYDVVQSFECEREDEKSFYIYSPDQEKVVWCGDTAAETLEDFMLMGGIQFDLTHHLINKCAKVEMWRESQEWFWDNVDESKLKEATGDIIKEFDESDLDDLMNDWAYHDEWIYDDDIISDRNVWEYGEHTFHDVTLTPQHYSSMGDSLREYLQQNK